MYIYICIYIQLRKLLPGTALGTGKPGSQQLSKRAKQPSRQSANHNQQSNKVNDQ